MYTIRTLKNPELAANHVAELLACDAAAARQKGESLHVCLSGGSTPKLLFSLLARDYAQSLPWEMVHFWWGDERCVPPDDPDSNFGVVQELLFQHINIPAGNIHRIQGETPPEEEAVRYEQELKANLPLTNQGLPVLDWVMLGMGSDGHTASLFPSMLPLDFNQTTVIAEHPESGQKRVSLGAGVLCAARKMSVLVTGESKAKIIRHIINHTPEAEAYPMFVVSQHAEFPNWVLDKGAASKIGKSKE